VEELKVSREVLMHFQCGKCKKWWTIGDAAENKTDWICPWCGEKGHIKLEMGKVKVGGRYKPYKGHVYRVVGIAKHSETLEELVIYEQVDKSYSEKMWARPKQMFLEKAVVAGKKKPRFEFLKKIGGKEA
jgi:DNA-directed RNA polymerase subunit RPC12/RpoP